MFLFAVHECEFIEVSRGSYKMFFVRNDDVASAPTKNSTWKSPNLNHTVTFVIYSRFFLFAVHECEFIEVTVQGSNKLFFVRNDDIASAPTKNSTWKFQRNEKFPEDLFISYGGSATEWRLGNKEHQNTDDYYFKGTYS